MKFCIAPGPCRESSYGNKSSDKDRSPTDKEAYQAGMLGPTHFGSNSLAWAQHVATFKAAMKAELNNPGWIEGAGRSLVAGLRSQIESKKPPALFQPSSTGTKKQDEYKAKPLAPSLLYPVIGVTIGIAMVTALVVVSRRRS